MKKTISHLIEKYFQNKCNPEEAAEVRAWFNTPEGSRYLKNSMDNDLNRLISGQQIQGPDEPEPDSEKLMSHILSNVEHASASRKRYRYLPGTERDSMLPVLKVAATLLILFTAFLIYFLIHEPPANQEAEIAEAVYFTGSEGQKRVTLGDGSVIHMNRNSEIRIRNRQKDGSRIVELQGEAYFDVVHDTQRTFQVLADNAVIEVLGTAFNVRNLSSEESLHVAVLEGMVSLSDESKLLSDPVVILKKGQNATFNRADQIIAVENFGAENSLTWKTGRFVFTDLSMDKVCVQLERHYHIQCAFQQPKLKKLKLTSNFSDDSPEHTFSVIAMSLNIDFRFEDGSVVWVDSKEVHSKN